MTTQPELDFAAPRQLVRPSQQDRILHHLLTHGSVTTWEAIQLYRITRLSRCIFDLRRAGHAIQADPIPHRNADGTSCTLHRYSLAPETRENVAQ